MNSYSDSGYQDASSGYINSQNLGKADLRIQHSYPGAGTNTLMRNARAEGQASSQVVTTTAPTANCFCQAENVSGMAPIVFCTPDLFGYPISQSQGADI